MASERVIVLIGVYMRMRKSEAFYESMSGWAQKRPCRSSSGAPCSPPRDLTTRNRCIDIMLSLLSNSTYDPIRLRGATATIVFVIVSETERSVLCQLQPRIPKNTRPGGTRSSEIPPFRIFRIVEYCPQFPDQIS